MTCPVCGKTYPCVHSARSSAALLDHEVLDDSAAGLAPDHEQRHWRNEVISRVQQHRARRRRRAGPDGSLELDFPEPMRWEDQTEATSPLIVPRPEEMLPPGTEPDDEVAPPAPPKIIRFPRRVALEPHIAQRPPLVEVEIPGAKLYDREQVEPELTAAELPEPALPEASPPRIVYAHEQPPAAEQIEMDLLPNFDDIRLDAPDNSFKDELQTMPDPAPIFDRAAAALIDGGLALIATFFFAQAFFRWTEDQPHSRTALLCAVGVGALLWLLLHYVFLVYGAGTPGMRCMHLELVTFEGERPPVPVRRWRVLATALSAFSMGLGFAWALIDEDQLGWHDRITATCMRSTQSLESPESDGALSD